MSAPATARAVYPEHLRSEIETYLGGLRFAHEPAAAGLDEAMRYSLMAGGKRIRPVLALATARALRRQLASAQLAGRVLEPGDQLVESWLRHAAHHSRAPRAARRPGCR